MILVKLILRKEDLFNRKQKCREEKVFSVNLLFTLSHSFWLVK